MLLYNGQTFKAMSQRSHFYSNNHSGDIETKKISPLTSISMTILNSKFLNVPEIAVTKLRGKNRNICKIRQTKSKPNKKLCIGKNHVLKILLRKYFRMQLGYLAYRTVKKAINLIFRLSIARTFKYIKNHIFISLCLKTVTIFCLKSLTRLCWPIT